MTMSLFRYLQMLGLSVLSMMWFGVVPVSAQAACPTIVDRIQLAEGISQQPSDSQEIFLQQQVTAGYQTGQHVILSSTPDGQGSLSTDDQITIQVMPSGREWSHDFRNAARTRIVPLPAHDVTTLFTSGANQVTLVATDVMGPEYSTRPYYLVIVAPCVTPTPTSTLTATATQTQTPTSTATATETPSPVATATPLPTATQSPTPVIKVELLVVTATPSHTPPPSPTATVTLSPTPTATAVPPTATMLPDAMVEASSLPSDMGESSRFLFWILMGFVMGFGGTIWWWMQRNQSLPSGEVDVYREGVYVTTYDLGEFGKAVVTVGKQGDIALPDLDSEGLMARIVATESEGEQPALATVDLLHSQNSEQVLESSPLIDGRVLTFGPYRLHYHSYELAPETNEEEFTHV